MSPAPLGTPRGQVIPSLRADDLSGTQLRVAADVRTNPRVPNTHGWLAFEVLRRAPGGTLSFDEYNKRLFHPAEEIRTLAKRIPGVPNAYQDLRHLRHDIRLGRAVVE